MNSFEWLPYLYASFWCIALFYYYKKCKAINGGVIILGVWAISALAGAWYENNLIFEHIHSITLVPYVYLFFFSFLLCIPVLRLRTDKVINITSNESIVNICIFMVGVISLLPFVENLIHFLTGLSNGSVFDIDAFNSKYEDELDDTYFMSNLGSKLEQIADSLRLLILVLLFYYFKRDRNYRQGILSILLFIAVANILLMGINSGSRNVLFTYIITSVYIYYLFSKFYSSKIKKKIRKIGFVFLSSSIVLFAIISFSRFSDISLSSTESRTLTQWVVSYAGESHGIFNGDTWHLKNNDLKNNDFIKNFYLYKTFHVINKPKEVLSYPAPFLYKNVQFPTVIGTYCTNYGKYFTGVASIIVCLLFSIILRNKPIYRLSDILLITYYAKIPLLGFSIFCYMYDGWQLLITPIVVIILKILKT